MSRGLAVILAAVLVLAGCQAEKAATPKGTAGGEILPGSVSDAMLPVDTVRSQPPLAPKATTSAAEPGKKAASKGRATPAEPAETKDSAPAADPEPAEAQ